MHIAVVGCGLSGSLLAYSLPRLDHKVDVYERNSALKTVCACATDTALFKEVAEEYGLNPDSYILWQGRFLTVKFACGEIKIDAKNSCTFDKERFMQDIIENSTACFHFGEELTPRHFREYDLVIDASGIRAVLGRLPRDDLIVCYQVRASFSSGIPFPDFLMDSSESLESYLWMSPLSRNEAYVGCGSREGRKPRSAVLDFVNRHEGVALEEESKMLRLNHPYESLPFIEGNVVGVGNSIGAITSLGEGIVPSVISAKLLLNNLTDLQQYKSEVLGKLGWLRDDHAAMDAWIKNERLRLLYHFIKCRRQYETRFGTGFKQSLKVLSALMKNRPSL
jgi:flavin-dependent dehydrogenase